MSALTNFLGTLRQAILDEGLPGSSCPVMIASQVNDDQSVHTVQALFIFPAGADDEVISLLNHLAILYNTAPEVRRSEITPLSDTNWTVHDALRQLVEPEARSALAQVRGASKLVIC